MNKLFRFAKVIARSIYKPAQKLSIEFHRLSKFLMMTIVRNPNLIHWHSSNSFIKFSRNHLQLIQVQNQEQIKQKFQVGLSELAKINAQLLKQTNYVRFAGDFSPCVNPEQFIHALQIYRQGALAQFYSIDDLETINSVYQSDSNLSFRIAKYYEQPIRYTYIYNNISHKKRFLKIFIMIQLL